MRIVCLGGGPAGLFFSILMKKAEPDWEITVIERNRPDDTFGWGVVFSDKTMSGFRDADRKVVAEIELALRHWDDIDVFFKGEKITSSGHGFCGIARKKLLDIFQRRATELGVEIQYETEALSPDEYAKRYDLVVGADGVHSITRAQHEAHFNPRIDVRKCRFIWLGTRKKLDAFTFAFKETEWGWFNLHAYRFDEEWSTFIVETPEETWLKAGLDKATPEASIALCEKLFADLLDGHSLVSNARHLRGSAVWLKFNRVLCERWFKDNIVLIGDAAHTAHFSIGSGTKLAMEDAISLANVLASTDGDVPARLARYQAEREVEALKLQSAARNRMTWFEDIERYVSLEPEQFVYSLLTGSQRIGHENQKLRDPAYVARVDRRGSRRAAACAAQPVAADVHAVPAARTVTAPNRVVVSPMCMYSAVDGVPERLSPRALRRARDGRRGAALHRDDRRRARGPHHPGLHGDLERRAGAGVEAHRRLRPRAAAGEDRDAARPRGPQGRDEGRVGGRRPAPRRGRTGSSSPRRRCRTSRASRRRRGR